MRKRIKINLNLIYEDNGVGVPVQNKPELFREGFSTGGLQVMAYI